MCGAQRCWANMARSDTVRLLRAMSSGLGSLRRAEAFLRCCMEGWRQSCQEFCQAGGLTHLLEAQLSLSCGMRGLLLILYCHCSGQTIAASVILLPIPSPHPLSKPLPQFPSPSPPPQFPSPSPTLPGSPPKAPPPSSLSPFFYPLFSMPPLQTRCLPVLAANLSGSIASNVKVVKRAITSSKTCRLFPQLVALACSSVWTQRAILPLKVSLLIKLYQRSHHLVLTLATSTFLGRLT